MSPGDLAVLRSLSSATQAPAAPVQRAYVLLVAAEGWLTGVGVATQRHNRNIRG
jgi:hypothetical protein